VSCASSAPSHSPKHELQYFKHKKDKKPAGSIALFGAEVNRSVQVTDKGAPAYCWTVSPSDKKRKYFLGTSFLLAALILA
jgi:hypothetical protein